MDAAVDVNHSGPCAEYVWHLRAAPGTLRAAVRAAAEADARLGDAEREFMGETVRMVKTVCNIRTVDVHPKVAQPKAKITKAASANRRKKRKKVEREADDARRESVRPSTTTQSPGEPTPSGTTLSPAMRDALRHHCPTADVGKRRRRLERSGPLLRIPKPSIQKTAVIEMHSRFGHARNLEEWLRHCGFNDATIRTARNVRRTCRTCQSQAGPGQRPPAAHEPLRTQLLESLLLDMCEFPTLDGQRHHEYIITGIYRDTAWALSDLLKTKDAVMIARFVRNEFLFRGIGFVRLIADFGNENAVLGAMLRPLGIVLDVAATKEAYHLGMVERHHATLKDYVRRQLMDASAAMTFRGDTNRDLVLRATFFTNETFSRDGTTPNMRQFGSMPLWYHGSPEGARDLKRRLLHRLRAKTGQSPRSSSQLPGDRQPDDKQWAMSERDRLDTMMLTRLGHRHTKLEQKVHNVARANYDPAKAHTYKVGQMVWLRPTNSLRKPVSPFQNWHGPVPVIEVLDRHAVKAWLPETLARRDGRSLRVWAPDCVKPDQGDCQANPELVAETAKQRRASLPLRLRSFAKLQEEAALDEESDDEDRCGTSFSSLSSTPVFNEETEGMNDKEVAAMNEYMDERPSELELQLRQPLGEPPVEVPTTPPREEAPQATAKRPGRPRKHELPTPPMEDKPEQLQRRRPGRPPKSRTQSVGALSAQGVQTGRDPKQAWAFVDMPTVQRVAQIMGLPPPELDICNDGEHTAILPYFVTDWTKLTQKQLRQSVWCNPPWRQMKEVMLHLRRLKAHGWFVMKGPGFQLKLARTTIHYPVGSRVFVSVSGPNPRDLGPAPFEVTVAYFDFRTVQNGQGPRTEFHVGSEDSWDAWRCTSSPSDRANVASVMLAQATDRELPGMPTLAKQPHELTPLERSTKVPWEIPEGCELEARTPWEEALETDPITDELRDDARQKELDGLHVTETWRYWFKRANINTRAVNMQWVDEEWKRGRVKARVVVMGNQIPKDVMAEIATLASTADSESEIAVVLCGVYYKLVLLVRDATQAFLKGVPLENRHYVVPVAEEFVRHWGPISLKEIWALQRIWCKRVDQPLYGLCEAPERWDRQKDVMRRRMNLLVSREDPSLWASKDKRRCAAGHVDDLLIAIPEHLLQDEHLGLPAMEHDATWKDPEYILTGGQGACYRGVLTQRDSLGNVRRSMPDYLPKMFATYLKKGQLYNDPATWADEGRGFITNLNYQTILGSLQYFVAKLGLPCLGQVVLLPRVMPYELENLWQACRSVCLLEKDGPLQMVVPARLVPLGVVGFADATLEQLGYIAGLAYTMDDQPYNTDQIYYLPMVWSSQKHKRKVTGISTGEMYGTGGCLRRVMRVINILYFVCGWRLHRALIGDSAAVVQITKGHRAMLDKTACREVSFAREQSPFISICHIFSSGNPSDCLTRRYCEHRLRLLMGATHVLSLPLVEELRKAWATLEPAYDAVLRLQRGMESAIQGDLRHNHGSLNQRDGEEPPQPRDWRKMMSAPNVHCVPADYPRASQPGDMHTQRFPDIGSVRIPPLGYSTDLTRVSDGPALKLSDQATADREQYLRNLLLWHQRGEHGPVPKEPPVQLDREELLETADCNPDIMVHLKRLGMTSAYVLPPSGALGGATPYAPVDEDLDELLHVMRDGPALARARLALGRRKGRTTVKALESEKQLQRAAERPPRKSAGRSKQETATVERGPSSRPSSRIPAALTARDNFLSSTRTGLQSLAVWQTGTVPILASRKRPMGDFFFQSNSSCEAFAEDYFVFRFVSHECLTGGTLLSCDGRLWRTR